MTTLIVPHPAPVVTPRPLLRIPARPVLANRAWLALLHAGSFVYLTAVCAFAYALIGACP